MVDILVRIEPGSLLLHGRFAMTDGAESARYGLAAKVFDLFDGRVRRDHKSRGNKMQAPQDMPLAAPGEQVVDRLTAREHDIKVAFESGGDFRLAIAERNESRV